MRRVATLTGGVALAASVLLVAPVSAAPSQRVSDTEQILFCEDLTGAGGTAFLFAGESEEFGSFADAAFWPPDAPPPNDPAWIAMGAEVDFAGTSVTGSILMVEFVPNPDGPPFGDPVGNAVLTATLTPEGEPEDYRFNDNTGNQVFRRSGTFQSYTVEGTLTMPMPSGATFDLSSCVAVTDTYTQFSNAPASTVSRFSSFNLSCNWETETGFIGLFAGVDEFGVFSDVFIVDGEEQYIGFPVGPITLTTEAFDATYEVFATDDGGDPIGSVTASATLSPGGRVNERFTFDNTKVHIIGEAYLVDGTATVTLDGATTVLDMDEASCSAGDVTQTEHISAQQGPKGKPLANDAPDGALPIEIGETVTVRRTGGTALEPEAPCILQSEEGDFEVPLGHTAWWTFTGTGSPVTVDTAGSDFDTVIVVYVDDGGSLTQVGCNDDDQGLQARLTVPTDAGVTYLVQVGGFGGATGSLVVSLE
jgi:hypothetical protein